MMQAILYEDEPFQYVSVPMRTTWAPALTLVAGAPRRRHAGLAVAMVDAAAVAAVERLAAGVIESWEQLEAAELSIRALVLHRHLRLLLPGFIATQPSGWTSPVYLPPPTPIATAEVWRVADMIHCVVVSDWVRNRGPNEPLRVVAGDSFWAAPENDYRGPKPAHLSDAEAQRAGERVFWRALESTPLGAGLVATPAVSGAATYFADERLELFPRPRVGTGEPHVHVADALYKAWRARFPAAQALDMPIWPGPFLAIVLSRASTRDQIPLVIQELRAQLLDPWSEVWHRMDDISQIPDADRVELELEKVLRAVEAVVPHATPRRFRPFRWFRGLGAAAKDIDAGAPLRSAAMRLGGSGLGILVEQVLNWSSVNSLQATKLLAGDLHEVNGFIPSLRRLLGRAELQRLGL